MCVRIRNCMTFQSSCHLSMIHIFWTCHYSFISKLLTLIMIFFFLGVKIEILMWWFLTYSKWNLTLNCQKRLMWWCMTIVLWIACNWSCLYLCSGVLSICYLTMLLEPRMKISVIQILFGFQFMDIFIDILGNIHKLKA